ncbi:MAG: ABC transporter substrate-binding protein [Peptococcaceae bacterium]|nr:ABC transporter substrate-binding protein [Peptococcaceae bacterium]
MRKRIFPVLFLLVLAGSLLAAVDGRAAAREAEASGISVKLNGQPVVSDIPPRLENGGFMVPLRPVLEAMGAKVSWYGDTGTAVACLPGATLAVTGGSTYAGINGRDCPMPAAAGIENGRLVVPSEIILEATGAQSGWDSATGTLSLFLKDPGTGFPDPVLDLQRDIQNELNRMDRDLAAAAGELARTGLDGDEARRILSALAVRHPYVADACTVDDSGKIVAIEPAAYHGFAGSDISGQEQMGRLKETGRPVLSSVITAVEGFTAVDLERPVFNRQNELMGSVSLLIRPERFFAKFAVPELQGQRPEMMVMQKDGYILYDSDSSQTGRNVFSDPYYHGYSGLPALTGRTVADRYGVGTYAPPDRPLQKQVIKRSVWTTVGLHGTEWRLILNYPAGGNVKTAVNKEEHKTVNKIDPDKTTPTLEVTPLRALAGDPWNIKVSGLVPGTPVTLVAEQQDYKGIKWESHAVFHADSKGEVDPGVQAPVSGSYEGADPAGLFWSLRPSAGGKPAGAFDKSLEPQKITVSVEVEGERILSREVERLYLLPGVKRVEVRESGVVGTLFIPAGEGKRPAIIVLGGSEGGSYEPAAAIYASHGYVALALAYFGMEGLPDSLVNIPLETVERAIGWLEAHPAVDKNAIGIWGASKGAELALLAASHYPQIKAVVAKSPSAVVFEGVSEDMGRNHKSSWSFKGEPVPFVPVVFTQELVESYFAAVAKKEPWPTSPMYEYALHNGEAVEKATIRVERINGPVLLVSGGLDGVWPAGKFSEMIMNRLKEKGHPFPDVRFHYPDAGHQISTPYSPTTVNWLALPGGLIEDLGGTPEGNAAASMDSWPKIIDFFRTHLEGGDAPKDAAGEIKIGVVATLSGDGSDYGVSIKQGLETARDRINVAGGVNGRKISLIIEDSRGDKDQAIKMVQKLINEDRVLAIIGPTNSGEMFAAGPVADKAGVVIMGTSNTAKGVGEIGPYVFRNSLPEENVIPAVVSKSKEKFGFTRVALLYSENNDWAVSSAETFKKALKDQGISIVETQTFKDGDTDFQAQLKKVAAAKPEALAVSALYKESALLLIQARQQGLNLPVMGGNGFNDPQLMKIAGEAAEGVLVGSPWFAGRNDPAVQALVAEYQKRYNTTPNQFAAQAYDALDIMAEALKTEGAAGDRAKFRDALASIKDYQGVTGRFSFDKDGNPLMDAMVLQVVNGSYREVK